MKIPSKENERIHERRKNNQGDWMEIVEYNGCDDIAVRFDLGGCTLLHKKYHKFIRGKINNPNHYLHHIGKRFQNKNKNWFEVVGMLSKTKAILRFDNYDDIVIRNCYDLNTSLKHPQEIKAEKEAKRIVQEAKRKQEKERIRQEQKKQKLELQQKWIGKTVTNHQGLKMSIIRKEGQSIDVQFEDGTIVKNKAMSSFKKHCICNPKYSNSRTISRNEFSFYYYLQDYGFKHYNQGELKPFGLGQYTVDLFNPELMVAIEYDGRFHKADKDHRKNKLFNKHGISIIRVREPNAEELNDGISINFNIDNGNNFDPALTKVIKEVITYINNNYDISIDCNVDVVRDRELILDQYLNETDYRLRSKRIGERNKNHQDLWLEIIDYRSADDIDVKFDIDGSIQKHHKYQQFKTGQLPHNKYNQLYFDRKERLGKTGTNLSGYKMKIVEYRNATDIDVMFEDGSIAYHKEYSGFTRGQIKLPSLKINKPIKQSKIFNPKDRVGERYKTNKGLWIEIIDYRSSQNVDIKFDIDGTILKDRSYQAIKKGSIRHPNRIDLIGNIKTNYQGYKMQIIKFRDCKDVDILFLDDQSVMKHQRFFKFQNGSVRHP